MSPEDDEFGPQDIRHTLEAAISTTSQRAVEVALTNSLGSIAEQIGKKEFEKTRVLDGGWLRAGEFVVPQQFFVSVTVVINTDNRNMEKKTIYGTNIEGSVHIQGPVTNAFNTVNNFAQSGKRPELAAQLDEVCRLVKELLPHLPEHQAVEVARDLENLTKEATSPQPRKKWYELSADGLIEAAKTVGNMAAPITTAVKAVLALIAP